MATTAVAGLLVPLTTWFYSVAQTVKEPYLDEVFHVRQAQNYCKGRLDVWDPKITTPPGLYLLSYAGSKIPFIGCDLTTLRFLNAIGLPLLLLALRHSYTLRATEKGCRHRELFDHSALNIVLFPPLFFFSALYYTDVWSTLLVIIYYNQLPFGDKDGVGSLAQHVKLVVVGLASLMFRQTNIFWVAVFPAAIITIQRIDEGHQAVKDSMYRGVEGFGDSWYSVVKASYKMQVIYDPPVKDAWINGWLGTLASTVACALKVVVQPRKLSALLVALAPYMTLMSIFTGFVIWNGSVVLGDKSNHIATLHLPQMLYIWPFITFFSWPFLYPYLLLMPISLLTSLPVPIGTLECFQIFKRGNMLPRLWLTALTVGIACIVVYGNTIIHPFTLADNRHYMFYIFRLLLQPWWTRYAVTPVYILCGWACVQALGGGPPLIHAFDRKASKIHPRLPIPNGQHSATTSFALIWLATSTLQLITAPLVEPRYFILPWIFWRMHLPIQLPSEGSTVARGKRDSAWSLRAIWESYDHRLWLETLWMLAVHAATGYIFLYWGFSWLQEPGQVQRFMW